MKFLSLVTALCLFVGAAHAQDTAQQETANMEVETFMLDNGLEVVVIPQRRVPVVTHMLWYKVGSADEAPGHSGIAHLFEHLMFKGTSNNGPGVFDAAVKSVGGEQNAFTSYDFTAYYQQVPPDALEDMMRLEADRMRNLVLTDEVIETERQVVIEERLMRVDNRPSGILREAINAALYRNSPYGRPVIGWMHEIEALTREQLIAFYDRYYRPNNAVLVVAGDVDVESVRELAEKTYGQLETGPELPPRERPTEPPARPEREVRLHDPRANLPSFTLNWFTPAYFSEQRETADALLVLSEILGGGERSRLHQALVVEQRIASAAGAFMDVNRLDYAQFGVYAQPIETRELDAVEQAVNEELQKVIENGISESELETAKKVLASRLIFSQENQMSRAREYGTMLMTGGTVEDFGKTRERIEAVTVDDIREAAQNYLTTQRSAAGYLLPEPPQEEDPA
ncbi:M16 family metallopeptidase [Chelativorans sp. YIM 93263]|uniref:M16 family metallopeptidase n=1 Tax=Chelativorans sp. YIM 93263 TaxID=2906648 RepID=UPI0023799213|nr:pitrilysin family protein [Chelativorans sp. YIM 93263]